jgi:hypothetical protein
MPCRRQRSRSTDRPLRAFLPRGTVRLSSAKAGLSLPLEKQQQRPGTVNSNCSGCRQGPHVLGAFF